MADTLSQAAPTTISEDETRTYDPASDVVEQANVTAYMHEKGFKTFDELYTWSIENSEAFWTDMANRLEWYTPWEKVLDDSEAPFYKWFTGAQFNIIHNAVDRHLKTWRRNKQALIWEGEDGSYRTFSYLAVNREISKFANILKSMGVQQGDIVSIYLPRIPELMFAMLACAKIGAAHSVIYGGFSVEALAERMTDAQSKVLITADGGWLRGKIVPLKQTANEAMARTPNVQTCIVVKRTGQDVSMESGRDYWYHELLTLPIASPKCETVPVDAEHPLYILYTSGTTGKPKGVLHVHAGYAVGISATFNMTFDIKEEDRWWCAADPGWVTGHSYIVYAPLIEGATSFMYEGAPNYPYPNRWWALIEKYSINILYTAPTAIRGLMRFGDAWPNRHDLSSLRLLGSVGEPINPEAWRWYHKVIGKEQCPIMDTWWQTETGSFMITPNPTTPLKPGSGTRAFLGIIADVVDETGKSLGANEDGLLVIKKPWPSMMRTILHNPERYANQYWKSEPAGMYTAGDSARKDEDGYFWVIGRIDDVIKVSGYRLGTAEVESALVSHSSVAEAAVIGLDHEVKGTAIHAFVILREGKEGNSALEEELKAHVGHEMGPIAKPEKISIVTTLPKTRSGKIMRRVLKAQALGQDPGDVSTLE
ncbi:MAG: acetate--CoA ligase [Chloroflexi bacterium AL-W]|nr:acetate--CoA ligase [Chloroflexi bacterium AL-N1]NOK65362.1 acetate--CoA ligase [Chloroflexi bacterium AL-N10]NOK72372.1 acetate--CoA ligase [Chloroflexi bacterium AL-N5]NOK79541.1 acetate--CoA ligase [Chloroflexi bacterium AL-W]NOK87457.1 acetate--CoA ligase [Chloroflexi bacterium AL-N15]